VPIAYVVAVIVSALVIATGLFGAPSDVVDTGYFAGMVFTFTLYVGGFSFLPALLAAVVAEIFRIRSILYDIVVGGALGFAAQQFTGFAAFEPQGQMLVVLLGAGFAGGLVYWLIAGRLAGIGDPSPQQE
jgi:hypothetical protein